MLRSPRRLVALAVLLLALAPAILPSHATIGPAAAARHEGQRVTVEGALVDARVFTDGTALLTIGADGHAIVVRAEDPGVPRGTWIVATGTLLRSGGELRLWADALDVGAAPQPVRAAWDQVAADPAAWAGRLVVLEGHVERGVLVHHQHRLTLGDGPWRDGPVQAQGVLAYEPRCLCHRLHGEPWTP